MIDPRTEYPGQVDTGDGNYPLGKARNCAFDGDVAGTPFERKDLNDRWGFQQALLKAVGATPSGWSESANDSQMLDAIKRLIVLGQPTGASWQFPKGVPISNNVAAENLFEWKDKVYLFGNGLDSILKGAMLVSSDDGETFTGSVTGPDLFRAAASDANQIIRTNGVDKVYKTTNGVDWTEHNAPVSSAVHAAIVNDRWVIGDSSDLHISADSGGTWADIKPAAVTIVREVKSYGGKLYVCHSNGISVSDNNGASWAALPVTAQDWYDIVVKGSEVMAVSTGAMSAAFSSDGGTTFSMTPKAPSTTSSGEMVQVVATSDGFVGFGDGGVYFSQGYGAPFVLRYSDFAGDSRALTVTSSGRVILAGADSLVAYSG